MKKSVQKSILLGFFILGVGLLAYGQYLEKKQAAAESPQPVEQSVETNQTTAAADRHSHAAFAIVVDGEVQDYRSPDFMHIQPCGLENEEDDHSDEPLSASERAHLHNQIGDVVHVHAAGVTWGTLLESLAVPGYDSSEWFVYDRTEAGATDALPLETEIIPYSQVVVSNQVMTAEALDAISLPDRAAIEEVEQGTLETCGSN